ncbi:MAG: glycosyltransferase family 4 protein [Alphaproteobacteria bacterium]|nr:glycosyltransferase family 4 protein [Alphaproteobacteria bacterium]
MQAGGVERGAVDVAAALARAGWRAFVVSSGGSLVHEVERAGARHIALPVHSKNPVVMRRNSRRLADLIQAEGIDIVHALSRAPAWSALGAVRRTGCHFVTGYHGIYGGRLALKRYYNAVMTRGERVIAISQFVAEHVQRVHRISADRIVTIHRGVNLLQFDPAQVSRERIARLAAEWRLPDGAPLIMLPGRLARWKGHLVLLQALARLTDQDAVCVLVGAGHGTPAYRRAVMAEIGALGLEKRVRLVDRCSDMPAAYMLADAVVSASTDPEAFGRVAVEAQAMGRPVIATDHGGARETVLPGVTGWLVPPGDAAALAGGLSVALTLDAAARVRMAELARAHVERRFTVEAMCAKTLALYRDVLARAA